MYRILKIVPSKIIDKPPKNTFLSSQVKLARISTFGGLSIHGAFKISETSNKNLNS
jgi:hypothetical protein